MFHDSKQLTFEESPSCPVFLQCGACQLLDIPYEEQLDAKQKRMEALFAPLAPSGACLPILGMENPYHYRHKVTSPFVGKRKKDARHAKESGRSRREILTGMYARGTHHLISTDSCLIEHRVAKEVIKTIRSLMMRWDMEPYDEDTGRGFLRHAVVRVGHDSQEVLLTLVTNSEEFPYARSFCRELIKRVPALTTVVQNINLRNTNTILGDRERTLYGPGFILDVLCGLTVRLSSHSFYQVNPSQAEVLYEEAVRLARIPEDALVVDAYCGTGVIGLVAAKRTSAHVIGVESVASAVADARMNAQHNGLENTEFITADAEAFMRQMAAGAAAADPRPLVLFMDPPRAGASVGFLEAATSLHPKHIVYISCNPKTQERDVRYLADQGYRIEAFRPVDMFPQTDHVENIVVMGRSEGDR